MFRISFLCLVLSAVVVAQSAGTPAQKPGSSSGTASSPASASSPAQEAAKAAAISPDTPVITIKNLCPQGGSATPSTPCTTVITKAEFEKTVNAVVPKFRRSELPPQAKQQIAKQFAQLLVLSTEAQKRGIEQKNPEVQEMLKLSRQQVLAQALTQDMMEQSTPSDAEVEKYYNENPKAYQEVTLQRLYIPKATPSKDKPVDANAEKAAAQKLHDRAAAGEDFDKLQKEAFATSGNTQPAPSTALGARRQGSLAPDQEAVVFGLAAGAVSPLIDNPAGWYVYKAVSKRAVPMAEVKEEISRKLQQQKFTDARNAVTNGVDTQLNEAYFGSGAEQEMMPGMNMQPGHAADGPRKTPTPTTTPDKNPPPH